MAVTTRGGPQVAYRGEQPYVAIPIRAALKEWGRVNALVPDVFGWLAANGIPPAGPPFFRYWTIGDMETPFDLEVGVPVAHAPTGAGRVVAGAIPAGSYATLIHTGHPDRLVRSLDALESWAANHGHAVDMRGQGPHETWGGRFEFYLTDPVEQPHLDHWSIEIAYLLRDDPATT